MEKLRKRRRRNSFHYSLGLVTAHPAWATPLAMAVAVIVMPLAIRALGRAVPPAPSDALRFESLRAQYRSLELWSHLVAVVGMVGAGAWVFTHAGNTPWLLGVIFGWLVLAPVAFIAICTLPRGVSHWHGFWRFYELSYGISLRLLAPVYAFLCALGILSMTVILSRQ